MAGEDLDSIDFSNPLVIQPPANVPPAPKTAFRFDPATGQAVPAEHVSPLLSGMPVGAVPTPAPPAPSGPAGGPMFANVAPPAAPSVFDQLRAPRQPRPARAPAQKAPKPDELGQIEQQGQALAGKQAEQSRAKAEAQVAGAGQEQDIAQEYQNRDEVLRKRQAEEMAGKRKELDEAEAARDKAGFRSYWADKGNGTKVLAGISVALSGLGQAFMAKAGREPGKNQALEIINKAIEDDERLQERQHAALSEKVAGKRQDVQDLHAAQLEARGDLAADKANKLDLAAKTLATEMAKRGVAQADIDKDQTYLTLRKQAYDARQQAESHHMQMAAMRADIGLKGAETSKALAEAAALKNKAEGQGREIYGPGGAKIGELPAGPKAVEDAQKVNASNSGYRSFMDIMKQLRDSYARQPFVSPMSEEAAKRRALAAQAQDSYRRWAAVNRFNAHEMQMVDSLLGGNGSVLSQMKNPTTSLDYAILSSQKKQAAFMDSVGLNGSQMERQVMGAQPGQTAETSIPKGAIPWTDGQGRKGYNIGGMFYTEQELSQAQR